MTWEPISPTPVPGTDGLHRAAVRGVALCVGHLDGAWHAVLDACTHEECELSDGYLTADGVECACHGARFDLRTGAVLEGPAVEPVAAFATRGAPPGLEVWLES